jgi:predicted metalloprotease
MRPFRMISHRGRPTRPLETGDSIVIKKVLIGALLKKVIALVELVVVVVAGAASIANAEVPPAAQAGCDTLEDCFTKKQMKKFVREWVVPVVDEFFVEIYGEDATPAVVYVKKGKVVETGCEVPADDIAYFHCGIDGTIYLGQNQLWDFYKNIGDIAPILAYAHEWGHHLQSLFGVEKVDQATAIDTENQADCIAGAWLQNVDEQGLVDYPDDLEDIDALLVAVGDAEENVNRDHGTVGERSEAVLLGFENGIAVCNEFFPEAPIYTAE